MFRVPNGVAHGAQVNVFHVDVIVTQIDDLARGSVLCALSNTHVYWIVFIQFFTKYKKMNHCIISCQCDDEKPCDEGVVLFYD